MPVETKLHYTLRLAVAMCFIGHGAFGIVTKPIWCNYFAVFGIGHDWSYRLMPILGTVDVLLGITMLVWPMRAILIWLVIWGIVTAALRPLSGEPFAEFIERAGNFGAPLALLAMVGVGASLREWTARISPNVQTDDATLRRVTGCLRIVTSLLLLGHGWLNLIEKPSLLEQYASLGFSNPVAVAHAVGAFEVVLAAAVLIRPLRYFVLAVCLWKVGTELFYPHYLLLEWVERGGSYGTLLSLWFVLGATRPLRRGLTLSVPRIGWKPSG